MLVSHLGAGVVGEPLPSQSIDDPLLLFPFHGDELTYHFSSGKNKGKTQAETLTKVERPNGKTVWRLQLTPTLTGYIREAQNGDIVMPAIEDSSEGALVITEPANPFLPKGMKPGETRSYSQRVSVRYLDDISNERYSGTLKSDYTYLGTFKVKVPAGTFDAIVLRVKNEGKIGPAHTLNTGYNLFAPGKGIVAMILQSKVTAFWIYNIDGIGGKVLSSKVRKDGD